jgi:hypothetical protein
MVVVKHKRVHQGNGYPATQATRSVRKRYILKMEWDPKAFDYLGFHMRQFFGQPKVQEAYNITNT